MSSAEQVGGEAPDLTPGVPHIMRRAGPGPHPRIGHAGHPSFGEWGGAEARRRGWSLGCSPAYTKSSYALIAMSIDRQIAIAIDTEGVLSDILARLDFLHLGDRGILATGLWAVCLYNTTAIRRLLGDDPAMRLYGPAATLLRPTIEMFVRACWIWLCADNEKVIEIARAHRDNGRWPLRIAEMREAVTRTDLFGDFLDRIEATAGGVLHSAVHGGISHISRHVGRGAIGQNVGEDLLVEIARLATIFAGLSSVMLCRAAADSKRRLECAVQLERVIDVAFPGAQATLANALRAPAVP